MGKGMKVFLQDLGHMTKMAARTGGPISKKLGM